nr:hypothetical protein CFP56_37041 [Quercus suber]
MRQFITLPICGMRDPKGFKVARKRGKESDSLQPLLCCERRMGIWWLGDRLEVAGTLETQDIETRPGESQGT